VAVAVVVAGVPVAVAGRSAVEGAVVVAVAERGPRVASGAPMARPASIGAPVPLAGVGARGDRAVGRLPPWGIADPSAVAAAWEIEQRSIAPAAIAISAIVT